MADPRIPPTAPLGAPPHSVPVTDPNYPTNTTTTTHIREPAPSTNWFAYLLGGAVIAVGVAALLLSGGDDAPVAPPAGSNNVTIEAPATAPAAVAPEAPAATTPDATAPAATPEAAPVDPAPVDPAPEAAPAPDAGTAAPAPTGN